MTLHNNMSIYKIQVTDRNYSSWDIYNMENLTKIDLTIDPIKNKLFTNDVFKLEDNGQIHIIHSSIRTGTSIPGVLILNGNKTYGREKKTKSKLLYKCIPDDVRIPSFLIPYEIKTVGFSKIFKNLYVTFNFEKWDDKHPMGKLDNVIGPVDIIDNFYEYQLYCKSLNASIQKFNKEATKAIEPNNHETIIETIKQKFPSIEDRTDQSKWNILTIDPPNSTDFDDGFSLLTINETTTMLSIYVSNVTIMIDVLNLWSSFSRRISTI